MDRLIALPVAGDAFLLERSGKQILVDGGSGSTRLLNELSSFKVHHLDVVVCTHADRDHAGGLVDFLDRSNVSVGEFWLPGAWAETLPSLINSPDKVVGDLINTLECWSKDEALWDSLEAFKEKLNIAASDARRQYRSDRLPVTQVSAPGSGRRNKEGGLPREWFDSERLGENDSREANRAFNRGRKQIRIMRATGRVSSPAAALFRGLINTAERVRRIALQAYRHRVLVRWFDFGEFAKSRIASGGEKGLLVPLNSVELLTLPPEPPPNCEFFALLTPLNEECLVFVSPPPPHPFPFGSLSVVFTGDSPLGDGRNYANTWLDWPVGVSDLVVATAPHHGSDSNSAAYTHLCDKAHVLLWVRSGGSKLQPGATYRGLRDHNRICTHCPHKEYSRQAAIVMLGGVVIRTSGHLCVC